MKNVLGILHLLAFVLALSACSTPPPEPVPDPRLAELEKTVADLKEQLNKANAQLEGEVLKLQTIAQMHNFDGSPLKDFFNAPEFWENTYDSGASDCCKRCAESNKALRKACSQKATQAERDACFADALRRVSNCVDGCSGRFPQQPQ